MTSTAPIELWILAAANVPLAVRPVGDIQYKLVGEVYVHGWAHDEAIREAPADSSRLITLI